MYQSADQPVRGPDHHPADEVLGTAEGLPAPLVSLLHSSHQHSAGINKGGKWRCHKKKIKDNVPNRLDPPLQFQIPPHPAPLNQFFTRVLPL